MAFAAITLILNFATESLEAPAALPGYLQTILKRTAWNKNLEAKRRVGDEETFDSVVKMKADERADPQRQLEVQEQARLLQAGLQRLKPVQRELLTRFYLKGEKPAEVCRAMNLTETQFRLGKSRSKQLLQQSVPQAMTRKPLAMRAAGAR